MYINENGFLVPETREESLHKLQLMTLRIPYTGKISNDESKTKLKTK